jgi:hypothetical protein
MSAEERARVERVARHLGLTPQQAFKFLMKRADDELRRQSTLLQAV